MIVQNAGGEGSIVVEKVRSVEGRQLRLQRADRHVRGPGAGRRHRPDQGHAHGAAERRVDRRPPPHDRSADRREEGRQAGAPAAPAAAAWAGCTKAQSALAGARKSAGGQHERPRFVSALSRSASALQLEPQLLDPPRRTCGTNGPTTASCVAACTPPREARRREAAAHRAARQRRSLQLLAEVREHDVRERRPAQRRARARRRAVAQVPAAARDPVLHRGRVRARAQHPLVVVRLEHQHVEIVAERAQRAARVPEVVARPPTRAADVIDVATIATGSAASCDTAHRLKLHAREAQRGAGVERAGRPPRASAGHASTVPPSRTASIPTLRAGARAAHVIVCSCVTTQRLDRLRRHADRRQPLLERLARGSRRPPARASPPSRPARRCRGCRCPAPRALIPAPAPPRSYARVS